MNKAQNGAPNEAPLPFIKDVLGEQPHVWVTIPQNPMKKPLWPPVTVRLNEYCAVLPRGKKVLVSAPLVAQLEHAKAWKRTTLDFHSGAVLSASEAHQMRLQTPDIVFPQTCAAPPTQAPDNEPQKKGK